MRVVGRENYIILPKPFHVVPNGVLLRLNRNIAVALEKLRRLLRQFYFILSNVVLVVIIQPPEQPWSPTAICFQKSRPEFRKAVEYTAGTQAYSRGHGSKTMRKGVPHHQRLIQPQPKIR